MQQAILSSGNCDHDQGRWRAFQASLQASGLQPSSEVLSCGDGSHGKDPKKMVQEWLTSPLHRAILLERPRATGLGCSRFTQNNQTVTLCTIWSPRR